MPTANDITGTNGPTQHFLHPTGLMDCALRRAAVPREQKCWSRSVPRSLVVSASRSPARWRISFHGIRSDWKLIETAIANTPARSTVTPFTRSASERTASSPLHRETGLWFHPTDERIRSVRHLTATASILNCVEGNT